MNKLWKKKIRSGKFNENRRHFRRLQFGKFKGNRLWLVKAMDDDC